MYTYQKRCRQIIFLSTLSIVAGLLMDLRVAILLNTTEVLGLGRDRSLLLRRARKLLAYYLTTHYYVLSTLHSHLRRAPPEPDPPTALSRRGLSWTERGLGLLWLSHMHFDIEYGVGTHPARWK